jgi:hypothetical protein
MNVAVAVAIGIIATLLIAGFGTILILVLLAMNRMQRSLVAAIGAFDDLRGQARALDADVDKLVALVEDLTIAFRSLKQDIRQAAAASMLSAESVQKLDLLLTGAQQPAKRPPPAAPPIPPEYMPRMEGPRPGVPPNPIYDAEATAEDQTELMAVSDEELAKIEERQAAREQGYETDPEADFPIPIRGVGVDAG